MLIDTFLLTFDVTERHHLDIHAPIEKVYAAVRELDVSQSRLIRALFMLRGLPAFMFSRRRTQQPLGLNLSALLKSGFVLLAETPPREIVLGLIGKFWTASGCIQKLTTGEFQNFTTPGFAKTVWNFFLEPQANGVTRLHTETRILCLDAASRRRFRFYWLFIRPFSGLIRMEALRAIKQTAEYQAST